LGQEEMYSFLLTKLSEQSKRNEFFFTSINRLPIEFRPTWWE